MTLHPVDLLVIGAYAVLTLAIGLRFARRNRTTERYFLGGRDFPGWAIGLSFIGSTISSITFIAYPADSFKTAWLRILPPLAFPLVVLLACYAFIPFFRRGTVHSAYHYLALRFGPSVSLYAALVYLTMQVVRAATITYLLAVLLSSMTQLPVLACIVLAAGVTAIYTIKGGFEAVVWTDVIQTIVLLSGAVVCVLFIVHALPGGLAQVFSEAWAANKLSLRDLNPATGQLEAVHRGFSLTEKTALMLVLVGVANYLAGQLDQDSVQRWCSAKSSREARKAMFVLGFGAVPIWAGFMFLGTCLWTYYQHFPSEVSTAVLAGTRKAEDILPHFIITVLPHGLAGLVISAALAAAMASLSSCINAASMVCVNDVYRPYLARQKPDGHYLAAGRLTSLAIALLMAGGAWLFYLASTKTILDFILIVTALLGGGASGAFVFGMFTRLGDARAVLLGIAATVLFTGYAVLVTFGVWPRLFNAYYTSILSNLIMFGTCCVAALLFPRRGGDLANLTVWDRAPEPAATPAGCPASLR
ncbi:MAG: sodium/solute symporter [Opitutaceae bacterium]|nr:sodium/solute symporter [Opitutaceae bacterium]